MFFYLFDNFNQVDRDDYLTPWKWQSFDFADVYFEKQPNSTDEWIHFTTDCVNKNNCIHYKQEIATNGIDGELEVHLKSETENKYIKLSGSIACYWRLGLKCNENKIIEGSWTKKKGFLLYIFICLFISNIIWMAI